MVFATDIQGPRVRLGLVWFVALMASLKIGTGAAAALYSVMAGLAALQIINAWKYHRLGALPWVAAVGAALIPLGAGLGAGFAGAAVLVAVGLAILSASAARVQGHGFWSNAGLTVQAAVPVGLAGAGMVLSSGLDIAAAVVLALLVSAYEAGSFLVGSGADSSWEGPVAGMVAVGAMGFSSVALNAPPFHGSDGWPFIGLAALLCLLGQFFGSLLLPAADAKVPALRRLDSLLLLGPAWAWLVGIYLTRVGH